jgi:hypothetical protein
MEQRGGYREKLINERTVLISDAAVPILKLTCPGSIVAELSVSSTDKDHDGLRYSL